jgi:MFS family permease
MRVALGRDVAVTAMIMGGSALGDSAVQVALVLRVHESTGSTWAVTALLLAGNLPAVLLAVPAGAIVDRCDSKVLIVGCALAQALVCLFLAFSSPIWVMVTLVSAMTVLATVTRPACNALVPDMVGPKHLLRANALIQGAMAAGRTAGWPLGGFLTGMLGAKPVVLLDAATFAMLAAGAMVIRTRRVPSPTRDCSPNDRARRWIDRTVDPVLPLIIASTGLVILFVSTTNVAQVFFVKDILGASDTAYGVVGACWMAGMVLGGPVVARGHCTRGALCLLVVAGQAITGIAVLGTGLSSSPLTVGIWYVFAGLGSSSMLMAGAALVGLVASGEARGRIVAVYCTLANAAAVPAMVLSVGLMSWLGARGVFLMAGTLTVMATALAGSVLKKALAVDPRKMRETEPPVNKPLDEEADSTVPVLARFDPHTPTGDGTDPSCSGQICGSRGAPTTRSPQAAVKASCHRDHTEPTRPQGSAYC